MSAKTARRIPGEAGIWIFIAGDMMMFALLFSLYTTGFGENRAMYLAGQATLDKHLGLLNTFVLLTGSLFVVLGLEAARAGLWERAGRLTLAGAATGVMFIIVKAFEYTAMIRAGHTLISNEFYTYYFMITGIHLVHVIIGVTVLTFFWKYCRRQGAKNVNALETVGCYWHMVDLLWIGIFALVYLVK